MNDQPAGGLTEQVATILGTVASNDLERAVRLMDALIIEYGHSSVVEAMATVTSSSITQLRDKAPPALDNLTQPPNRD